MVKCSENMENTLKTYKILYRENSKTKQNSAKKQEGEEVEPASKLSLVSGNYL